VDRSDPWHCPDCGATVDLAPRTAEVALVRLAVRGEEDFALGSAGIEDRVAPLLAACACGGRYVPGPGAGAPAVAAFDPDALRPVAVAGWERLVASEDPSLQGHARRWRPRAMAVLGRNEELSREDVLRLRLETKLEALEHEVRRATAEGDTDAAETAHARYIELGTTYVRRFVAPDERAGV
jgi:hypothetical protein